MKPSLMYILIPIMVLSILLVACKSDSENPTPPTSDTTPPTVTIASPANNSTVIDSVMVVASASDNVGVEKVEFYIDGTLGNTRSTVPWQYNWNVRSLTPNSVHTILAKAYDAANNIGTSPTISVTVNRTPFPDTTAPTVSITSPANNATVIDSVPVIASASDNVGVTKVEFYVDGSIAQTLLTLPWQYNWNVRSYPNNSLHTILAKAYDAANNVGSSTTLSVTTKRTEQALQFNGTTDYVRLPSSTSLTSFGTQITIEAWVRLSAYGLGGAILNSGNENEYAFSVRADGKLGVTMVFINPQVNHEFISRTTLGLNTWYHVAFAYNGSIESILINGVVDTSFSSSGIVNTSQYVENISIGAYSYNNHTQHGTFLSGILDEVRIWNVSRSSSQIQAAMNTELTGSESGLMGYWRFNGNAVDGSPNGNNGTIFGSPVFVSIVR